MRAIFFPGDKTVQIRDFPTPKPADGEVLIRIKAFSICGSDLGLYRGVEKFDAIPGHEPCGVIEEIGKNVTKVKTGDRVVIYHIIGCGQCGFCQVKRYDLCKERKYLGFHLNGADAEYLTVREEYCLNLPLEMSFSDGCLLACNFGTAFSAVRKIETNYTSPVVIFGLGPVGMSVLLIAKTIGLKVIGVDLVEDRLQSAERLGADLVINSKTMDVISEIKNNNFGEGVDTVLECSGNVNAQTLALNCVRTLGQIIFVGHTPKLEISPSQIIMERLKLIGSWVFTIQDYQPMVHLVRTNRISLQNLISHHLPVEDINRGFQLYDQQKTAGKVIFEWE